MAKKIAPLEEKVFDRGDKVEVQGVIEDAHDRGNIVVRIGSQYARVSHAELVEHGRGGRVVLKHPLTGAVLQDSKGVLGPTRLDESALPDDPDAKDDE